MTAITKDFDIKEIYLNESNPRFLAAVDDQVSAINALLDVDSPSKMINLAQDIVERASLNPAELPIVKLDNGRPVVLEGNRRIAALKLLRDPDLAISQAVTSSFRQIASKGLGPSRVTCAVVESTAEANPWIELRHTGENNGVGILRWRAYQVQNFARTPGTQSSRAAIFLAGVRTHFPENNELIDLADQVLSTRFTTLGRVVGDPDVRSAFGFTFNGDKIEFQYPNEEILPVILKVLQDLASHLSVSALMSKEQRLDYIDTIQDYLPKSTAAGQTENPSDSSTGDPAESTDQGDSTEGENGGSPTDNRTNQKKRTRQQPRPERVIFQDLKTPNLDSRITKLISQCQKIKIDESPAVAGVMIRVILELTLDDAIRELKLNPGSETFRDKFKVVIRHLDPKIADKSLADPKLWRIQLVLTSAFRYGCCTNLYIHWMVMLCRMWSEALVCCSEN